MLSSITFLALFASCGDLFDKALCGEPEGEQKNFIESTNKKFQDKFVLKHVACYKDYMRIDLKTDYDKNTVDSLEKAYTQIVNYAEFLVYDKDGKLIRGNTGSM